MSRRRLINSVVCLGLAAAAVCASAATPAPPQLPRNGCAHLVTDPEGDAHPDYGTGGTSSAVVGSNPALDITGVDLRVTPDELQVFLAIKAMPTVASMQVYEASYRYLVTFAFSGKTFTYGVEFKNTSSTPQPLDGGLYPMANIGSTVVTGSTANIYPGSGATPTYAVFRSPMANVIKSFGNTPFQSGDKFTAIVGSTQVWTSQAKAKGDDTTVPVAQAVYTVGVDPCFAPPPTSLGALTAPTVQWGRATTLSATLHDEKDQPIAGKPISFTVDGWAGDPLTATTDDNGVATLPWSPTAAAGSYAVTATFAGDDAAGKSSATGVLVIQPAVTAFLPLKVVKPTATTRVVTATLVRDDKSPIAGQRVDWWIDGKKVATLATNSRGQSIYKGAKPGHYVQAKFAGVKGSYNSALSARVRV